MNFSHTGLLIIATSLIGLLRLSFGNRGFNHPEGSFLLFADTQRKTVRPGLC